MPRTADIIKQLIAVLPALTNKFSKALALTSLTQSAGVVTATAAFAHGFETGDLVNISGAIAPINVTNLVRNGNIVSATTAEAHDLTFNFQETIEIVGAVETEYNGTHLLLSVPNRRSFSYSITGTPPSPATGNIFLYDGAQRGYNGRFEIVVVSPTVFTYNIASDPVSPAQGNSVVHSQFRISGGADIIRIIESYSAQDAQKSWLFVVRGPGFVNKTRQQDNDATYSPDPGNAYRQQVIKPFDVYWFTPTISEIGGRRASDESEEVEQLLVKALCGVKFPFLFCVSDAYQMAYTGEKLFDYNGSYYVHEYSFEITTYITFDDTVEPTLNVAFRDIELELESQVGDETSSPLTVDINLDNDPLP